jgi:hypothetical protein
MFALFLVGTRVGHCRAHLPGDEFEKATVVVVEGAAWAQPGNEEACEALLAGGDQGQYQRLLW